MLGYLLKRRDGTTLRFFVTQWVEIDFKTKQKPTILLSESWLEERRQRGRVFTTETLVCILHFEVLDFVPGGSTLFMEVVSSQWCTPEELHVASF